MREFMVRALGPDTWDGFAGLARRHNGVFGGCWCTYFHTMHSDVRPQQGHGELRHALHRALTATGDVSPRGQGSRMVMDAAWGRRDPGGAVAGRAAPVRASGLRVVHDLAHLLGTSAGLGDLGRPGERLLA